MAWGNARNRIRARVKAKLDDFDDVALRSKPKPASRTKGFKDDKFMDPRDQYAILRSRR